MASLIAASLAVGDARAEDLLLLLAVAGLDGDLRVELAQVLLDDAVVPIDGLGRLEDLELAGTRLLLG